MKVKRDIKLIINKLIGTKFEDILNSDLSLELMYVYSVLYNNGSQPSWCSRCLKNYYNIIKINGLAMAIKYEEVQNRTCEPVWNGLKYIHKAGRHYSDKNITDKQAIELLESGMLSEKDFNKLPEGYKKIIEVGCIPLPPINNTEPQKEEIIELKKDKKKRNKK